MFGFDPLELLYTMYHQNTISRNPNFWQKVNIEHVVLPDDKELINVLKNAFDSFSKSDGGRLKGSVHLHPDVWFDIFITKIKEALTNPNKLEKDAYNINIPNGCCSVETCPIRLFNLEILKLLKTEPKN